MLLCIAEDTTAAGAARPAEDLERKWTYAAVLHLLRKVHERYHQLTDKLTKNKCVWRDIARALGDDIPVITDGQCSQKWRNLKQQWKKYVDKQGKTGQGRMVKPEFHDEIVDIVGRSHTVQPSHTMETMAGPSSASEPLPAASGTANDQAQTSSEHKEKAETLFH